MVQYKVVAAKIEEIKAQYQHKKVAKEFYDQFLKGVLEAFDEDMVDPEVFAQSLRWYHGYNGRQCPAIALSALEAELNTNSESLFQQIIRATPKGMVIGKDSLGLSYIVYPAYSDY